MVAAEVADMARMHEGDELAGIEGEAPEDRSSPRSGALDIEHRRPDTPDWENGPGKVCPHCHQKKAYAEYGRKASTLDGHQTYCKDCTRELARKWNKARRARLAAQEREGAQETSSPDRRQKRRTRGTRVHLGYGILTQRQERQETRQERQERPGDELAASSIERQETSSRPSSAMPDQGETGDELAAPIGAGQELATPAPLVRIEAPALPYMTLEDWLLSARAPSAFVCAQFAAFLRHDSASRETSSWRILTPDDRSPRTLLGELDMVEYICSLLAGTPARDVAGIVYN